MRNMKGQKAKSIEIKKALYVVEND